MMATSLKPGLMQTRCLLYMIQNCGDLLTSIITESRQRRWREFVETTNLTHSSRKAWKTIRILGNDCTKAQPVPQVTTDQVAHRLLVNSQGNPNHHPPRANLPKADAAISEETSHFTRPFSMDDLRNATKDMKNNKAAGLDDILCEQIKHFGPLALQWLLDMLNQSLNTNRIPKIWRKSRVIALLKPGKDPSIPKNYRPISLLCHTYKLFERLILNRTAPLVDELLIPEQAGFRPGKSCTGQLLNLTQYIEDGYEKGLITGAVFVDLSAAYDTVNHRILTKKLFQITKDVRLTELIQNLLSNRRFFVDLNGNRSRWRRQKNGLPQGSVLAPILFNIYTND
ncbi:Hypp8181 [Branchiostoma lanceolatum]|uniref:Hypp8181 protein n=1 Tax=Branchiostoma lanceolatum TaxID=7740 RepID=A0A8J9Z7Y1_BRALA|nr:Hypp8181 [Branchiostoma lanceolatum]